MAEVLTSGVAERRRRAAAAFLRETATDARALFVVANRDSGMGLLRELANAGRATFGWEVLTLSALAHRLALPTLARLGKVPASPLGRLSVCARLLGERRDTGALGRFDPVATQPGFPAALAQTLHELSMEGVDPAALAEADPDLAALHRGYLEALDGTGLVDAGQVFAHARAAVEARAPAGLAATALLALDPPIAHRREGELLGTLMRAHARSLCVIPEGDGRAHRWLTQQGLPAKPEADEQSLFDNALQRLQRHLFEERAPQGHDDHAVTVLSAPGEARECVELVRHILWAAARGVPFDRIAVLPRRASAYQPYLAEAFRRAGIPAHFTHQSRRPDPAGRALLSLLACKAEDLSARRFAEFLSLHTVPRAAPTPDQEPEASAPFVAPEGAWERSLGSDDSAALDEPDSASALAGDAVVDGSLRRPARWEQLLVDAAVIGGRERWARRLAGLEQSLRMRREQEDRDGETLGAIDRMRDDLRALTDFALPLLDRLVALPETATWGQWLAALSNLATHALRRPARVLSVLAELSPMSELGPVNLAEVQWVLRTPLSELLEPAATDGLGKVFVGSAHEVRGMAFDLVCVPGLSEKIFPEKLREDPLLLDETRRAVDTALTTNRDRTAHERLALRLAVGAARNRVILSYPRIDLERVRPRVPSFYGLEVLRSSEGRLPSYDELMARAERTADIRIGWPAPRDARDAIDAAEHDLAVLEQPLLRGQKASMGAARYLLEVNAHLARALRFRARRWELSKFSPADGLVDPSPSALAALQAHRPSERTYSATALQTFALCPYQFYLRAVLGLRAIEPPESIEHMDAQQRGALFHAVQFATLSQLRRDRALPVTPKNLATALASLDEVLSTLASQEHERLAPAIERVWQDGIADLRSDLRQWLHRQAADPDWVPTHFELAFGLRDTQGIDPESRDEAVELGCGLTLRGSIDLVEQRMGYLRATDHKTGRVNVPDELRIAGGKALQPGLYGLALQALFPERQVDAGRLYFCTSRGGFEARSVPIDDALRDALTRFARTLEEALTAGFLPAAPDKGACERCDYRSVCGPYEEQRLQRKRPERLQPLIALRREP